MLSLSSASWRSEMFTNGEYVAGKDVEAGGRTALVGCDGGVVTEQMS